MTSNLTLFGTDVSDTLLGGNGNDEIYGGGGADSISGGSGNDNLFGGSANDTLNGGTGNDQIYGGAGNDRLIIGTGNQLYDGGDGTDTLDASGAIKNVQIDLTAATVRGLGNSEIRNVEQVIGTQFADTISGREAGETLQSGGGDDTIRGGAGGDTLVGGAGNDRLYGEAGNDRLVYDATTGKGFTHVLDGGSGIDTLELRVTTAQLTADVRAELAAFSTFTLNPLNAGKAFNFTKIGFLQVTNIETIDLVVDNANSNAAPVIDAASTDAALTVSHNHAISGTVAATDSNGDALSYSLQAGPANGTVTFTDSNGHYTYTAGNSVGADSFVLQVSDGHGGVTTQTVSVDVTNAGPALAAGTDAALTVGHNRTVTGAIAATDADGDALSYSLKTGPANGTVTFTDSNGHYTYTAGNGVGADSFVLQVSDGHGGVTTQTVMVDVTNTGPAVAAGTTTTAAAMHLQSVAGTIAGSDLDGDTLTYSVQNGPRNGAVTFTDGNGHYVYTAGDAAGVDSFTLQISDGHGGVATQTVSFGVTGTLDLSAAGAATTINLVSGAAVGASADILKYTIDIKGSAFNDLLTGDARSNVLFGGDGKDELHGGAGSDNLNGGTGDDKLYGEDGADYLDGGAGTDQLNGGAANDTMLGGDGNDGFFGGGGNDAVYGGAGNDRVYGDGGNDTIFGGAGNDTMTGGTTNGAGDKGLNTYAWTNADAVNANGTAAGFDHVTDFGAGDRLDFSQLFASHPAVLSSVVHVTDAVAGTVVSAAVGANGAFVDVVMLDGLHHVTLDDLVHNNQIVA